MFFWLVTFTKFVLLINLILKSNGSDSAKASHIYDTKLFDNLAIFQVGFSNREDLHGYLITRFSEISFLLC